MRWIHIGDIEFTPGSPCRGRGCEIDDGKIEECENCSYRIGYLVYTMTLGRFDDCSRRYCIGEELAIRKTSGQ